MEPDQLRRYRRAVDDELTGAELAALVDEATAGGIEVRAHDIAWRQWPVGAWLGTAEAKNRVVALLRAASPLYRWLEANAGP